MHLKAFSMLAIVLLMSSAVVAQKLPTPPQPNPGDPVDYIAWYNETFGAGIADADNAAILYARARQELKRMNGGWDNVSYRPWSENPKLIAWLDENREALTLFKEATMKRDCFFAFSKTAAKPDRFHHAAFSVLLTHLPLQRELARGVMAEGQRALSQGNLALATANGVTLVRAGHHLSGSGEWMEYLTGLSIASYGYHLTSDVLASSKVSTSLVSVMSRELHTHDAPFLAPHKSYQFDRVFVLDFLQRYFMLDNQGGYTLHDLKGTGYEGYVDASDDVHQRILSVGYAKHVSLANDYFDIMERWLGEPLPLAIQNKRLDELEAARQSEHLVLNTLLPPITRSRVLYEQAEVTRQATHLIVKLHIIKAKQGHYPESLEKLKGIVPVIDPYSGKPLVYRRTKDDFLLYSFGGDFDDDDGTRSRGRGWGEEEGGGDCVFWPVQDVARKK